MILMKEYVSLTTAVMKMSKKFFIVIIAAPKREKLFIGWFHVKSSRACHPYLMDFYGVFTSGRYHRDMKIVKMLAPNSKQFRFSGIFKNDVEIAQKLTGIKLLANPIKVYNALYICEKNMRHCSLVNFSIALF